MIHIVKKFSEVGALVVGDIMLDQYVWGKVRRISPEAPVPIVEVTKEEYRLGGAGNVVNNIASLGGRAYIAGVAGSESRGKRLKKLIEPYPTLGIFSEKGRPTSVKTRIIAHSQQVVRIDREDVSPISQETHQAIMGYIQQSLPFIQGIIISDYAKGVVTKKLIEDILALAGSTHYIAVDPKIGHFDYYHDVDLITPNVHEASHGAGVEIVNLKTLLEAGRILMEKLRCRSVLITRGEEGMSLFESPDKVVHIPTCAKRVFDVTGAGDTVIATFVLSKCAGAALKEAAIIANHAAGMVVGEVGAATVTSEQLIESILGEKNDETCQ
jgi:D-beta-D-heptose 7-phosphate kinase/D-beta-D-heptose 1-phosphate adenosyltransferase